MHHDEIAITEAQVAELIAEQAPRWRGLAPRRLNAAGTVHAIFRVGGAVTARFPLRSEAAALVADRLHREASAMTEFLHASAFPAPEPLLVGAPGHGYPLPWSLQTWIPGTVASPTAMELSLAFADDLASLISGLRAADARGRTFDGDNRGGDLGVHEAWVGECIARSEELLDTRALLRLWLRLRDLPREEPDCMSHTDLIPGNLLVEGGRLVGVLDTGDFRAADPALDLVAGWHLLADGPRSALRTALGCSDLQWERGKAWAFVQAVGLVWYYTSTNPTMALLGRTTLARLLGD